MKRQIRIKAGSVVVTAELNNTRTADAIWQALPFTSDVHIWGEEVYFPISVKMELQEGREVVNLGDLGYWPPGSAFCIFFGPTPVSRHKGEVRAASAVNVFGRLIGDPKAFKKVKEGEKIVVERA